MMKKNYVWALLASMFMVGCSQNDDLPENPGEDQKVEKEVSYIAINVNAAPNVGGRAATGGDFAEGSANENKVETACFFFFDKEGNAFNVTGYVPTTTTGNNNASDSNSGATNWVKYTLTGDEGENGENGTANVERMLGPVLVIETEKSVYPASVVAVLNWEPSDKTQGISLENLRKSVLTVYKNGETFIMSNSVYLNGATPVYCTPLSEQNFADEETAAENHPVDIYVERVAVKANVSTNVANNKLQIYKDDSTPLSISIDNVAASDVYVNILGWSFNMNNSQTSLMKVLDDVNGIAEGPALNDPTNFRSYWANASFADDEHEGYNGTTPVYENVFTYNAITDDMTNAKYCLENTDQTNYTQVIVKGKLVKENEDELNIAQWYGKYYTCDDADNKLLTAVASAVGDRLYSRTGSVGSYTYTPITAAELKMIWAYEGKSSVTDERELYTVVFGLADSSKEYYAKDGETPLTADQIASVFASLSPAKYWKNGAVYYYLPIEHFLKNDTDGSNINAVIRNHFYDIKATKVIGLGTPVPAPDKPTPPVKPEDWETYIAAKINVLAWKTVSNNVTLQ